ncbi:FtsX-like permease family protein [uncultured Sunxiuqinia sp.]|uniref:ABC transporter permease n=1 Tax=uncultured Sunxiuqinia sp. TaxID=1573825 RepID=UPI002628F26A|nr:FtsX-like permease family protein [uncultured Sunxiuqinia sp.]
MFSKTNLNLIIRNWRRNKVFTIISILSLIIGLTCCNLLIAFVANEWQISEGSPAKDRIFLLKSDNPMDVQSKEKTSFILPALPSMMKDRYHEVETFCRFKRVDENVIFEADNFRSDKLLLVSADRDLDRFFTIPTLYGDVAKTLSSPGEAAVSASKAKLIFGEANVVGKTFLLHENNNATLYTITSVVDDSEAASFLKFDVLLPIDLGSYYGGVTFVKLDKKASSASVLAQMKKDGGVLPKLTQECQYYLQPLTDVYFDTSETQSSWEFLMHRDRSFLYISILATIAILFISCFNYMNMYLVRMFQNEKNTGIQEILGADKKQLGIQLVSETFLAVFLGFLLSFILVILLLPVFNSLFNAYVSLSFLANRMVIAGYLILLFLLIAIPSLYLFIRMAKNQSFQFLKNDTPKHKARVVNGMVVLQFTISIILIVGAMMYAKQLDFITETSNIDKNIIQINGGDISGLKLKAFKNDITALSGVQCGTLSSSGFLNAWIAMNDDNVSVLTYTFDSDFLKTHSFRLIEGEIFSKSESVRSKQVVVNETFVRKYGIDDPVGKTLPVFDKSLVIKGVIADFYTEPFSKQVKPTIISLFNPEKGSSIQVLQLRLNANGLAPTLSEIKKRWEEYFPDKIFNYTFIRDEFEQLHSNYSKTARIIGFFTIISLSLTAFGLFGMTWYAVDRRTKEIGIRKVNGATISEILTMLNKDFVKWVVIAFVLACPIAWYAMSKWLENFAYKTTLSWWIFALAGLLALGIALLTVSWQSWRAATRNPVEALRYE